MMVSIIILNYNGKQYLKECISSVLLQSYSGFELIFFDNNSGDGSIEYVKSNFDDKRIKIISNNSNLGFAGGNNEALKHCSNDSIVLLNNDTKVEKNWLLHLVNSISAGNTLASSYVITKGIESKYYETNGSVSYLMYNIMNIFQNIEDEFYPNGCSLIFRKSEIGEPFDKDYFYYGEDVYLGLRARFKGMNIRFVKQSIVHHYGGGTDSTSSRKSFFQERNRFLNLYLFFSPLFILRLIPYITFNHTTKLFLSLFSAKYSFPGLLKAYLWFYFNIPTVLKKRKLLRSSFVVNEKEVIKFISSRIFNNDSAMKRAINKISYIYSRLVGLKPVEYFQKTRK